MPEGEYKFRIQAETNELGKQLKQLVGELNNPEFGPIGGLIQGVQKFVTSPIGFIMSTLSGLLLLVRSAVSEAAEVKRMSIRAGISQPQAEALAFGGRATGTAPEELVERLNFLRRAQGNALMGSKELVQAFGALGFELKDLQQKTHFEIFSELAKRLESGALSAEQFAAASRLLGRDWSNLLVAFRKGLAGKMAGFETSPLAPTEAQTAAALATGQSTKMVRTMLGSIVSKLGYMLNHIAQNVGAAAAATILGPLSRFPLIGPIIERGRIDALARSVYGGESGEAGVAAKEERLRQAQSARAARRRTAELEQLQRELEMQTAAAKEFSPIRPDPYARMGLYMSVGAAALSQETMQLNRQSLSELKAIKAKIETLTAAVNEAM